MPSELLGGGAGGLGELAQRDGVEPAVDRLDPAALVAGQVFGPHVAQRVRLGEEVLAKQLPQCSDHAIEAGGRADAEEGPILGQRRRGDVSPRLERVDGPDDRLVDVLLISRSDQADERLIDDPARHSRLPPQLPACKVPTDGRPQPPHAAGPRAGARAGAPEPGGGRSLAVAGPGALL